MGVVIRIAEYAFKKWKNGNKQKLTNKLSMKLEKKKKQTYMKKKDISDLV